MQRESTGQDLGVWTCSVCCLRCWLRKSRIDINIHRTLSTPHKSILLQDNIKNKVKATFTLKTKKNHG